MNNNPYFSVSIKITATMKKAHFTAIAILFVPLLLHAQADRIQGTWYNDDKTSTIEIQKQSNGRYEGKITWLDEPMENGKRGGRTQS